MKYWPIAAALFAATTAFSTMQFQLKLHSIELEDLSEGIDELEDAIDDVYYYIDN